ncbi:MAG: site-2 protease family protein [Clostridia bacterium]|nr:site-2 protease family protein [Clostridia bacterium]
MKEDFFYILARFLAVALVLSFHEFAHAFAAYKCGDPTAKFSGRMTLNPVKHFDPLGVIVFALTGFGWAKPVPVNPNNFNNYRKGCFWTSAAGVLMNYAMAFLLYPVLCLVEVYVCPIFSGTYMEQFLLLFFYFLVACSLSFCVFNLLPLYPLDGFRIIDAVNTKRGKIYQFLREKGQYVLLALIFVHYLSGEFIFLQYIDILGYALDFAIEIFGKPITLFWNWILKPIYM